LKEYNPENIRNLAFIGHGGSGKTTLSEVILYTCNEINRIGNIDEGSTVSDYNKNEIERQISISATPLHAELNGTKLNIMDTPGYSDFSGQVVGSLHVVDMAVCVAKGAEGIEVGTETTWEMAKSQNVSLALVVNKIDNEHSNFDNVIESAKSHLSNDVTVVTFPLKEGPAVDSVVDLIKMKVYKYEDAASRKFTLSEIPADVLDKANALREELIEKIAESNEELMNKFFEEGSLTDEEIEKGLKQSILDGSLIPMFAVSALKGVGVQNFLEFASKYFPSPADKVVVKGELADSGTTVEVKCDPKGELVLQIFKSLSEAHVGELSIFKVFSGTLQHGIDLYNSNRDKTERIGQFFILNGKERKEVGQLMAGDIGAVVKLKDTHTGDTLCTKNFTVKMAPIDFPQPIIRGAVKPKSKGDEDKISTGLHTVHEEDPTLKVVFDPEIGQTIISGQGELQLNLAVKMLKDRYNVDVDLVEPRIPYRETIKGSCQDAEYKHKKQSGGRGQYGHVHLKLDPVTRGSGYEFVDAIVGGVVPGRFIPAVEKGLNEIMVKGILTGSKVIDVKVTLFDGTYHNVDSDEISFKIAAAQAFKKGFLAANPVILEPIYDITIKVPEEFMGDVMGDISSRRGKILGMDSAGLFQIIKAKVPLGELYKYSTNLRSLTAGRGTHSREFSHYEEVPKEIESKIIEDYNKSKEEE